MICAQGERKISIDRDKFLMPFLFRQQLDHLRRPGMHASHRLMGHAAGCRAFGRPGISKPLYREGRAAEFLVHDGICYIQKLFLLDFIIEVVIQLSGIDQRGRAGLSFYLHGFPTDRVAHPAAGKGDR